VDDGLVLFSELALRLGVPFHSPGVARTLVDKRRQRAALAAAGVPGPDFWTVDAATSLSSLRELAASLEYPVLVKPALGSGSRGIHRASCPADVEAMAGSDFLVEELLPDHPDVPAWRGSYLSIESVVSGGRTTHVASTGRFPLAEDFRETGNFLPALADPAGLDAVIAVVDASLAALSITTSVVHTEIKLTPSGPKLIEVNGRLGGRPPYVLGSVGGINLFQTALEVAVGRPAPEVPINACDGVGFWLMWQPPAGAGGVRALHGTDVAISLPGVKTIDIAVRAGEPLDPWAGTDGKVLTVRGRVESHDELEHLVAKLRETIRVDFT